MTKWFIVLVMKYFESGCLIFELIAFFHKTLNASYMYPQKNVVRNNSTDFRPSFHNLG